MRWPLRNQIFVPIAALMCVAVLVITVVSAWHASESQRAARLEHMRSIAVALADANFPLSQNVVDRVSGLVSGDVVVLDARDRISATTLSADEALANDLRSLRKVDRTSFEAQSITWNDRVFLVAAIRRSRSFEPETICILIPQTKLASTIAESLTLPAMVALPILLTVLLIAMVISRRVGRRVEKLQALFQQLADGNFQTVPIEGRRDEIRDLLVSANDLSGQLMTLQEELQSAQRLELLGQLSGGLAHQLRNSITAARLAIQLHQREYKHQDSEMLDTALAQLKLTQEQVQAVLSLKAGRVTAGSDDPLDVEELVQDVVALLRPQSSHWKSDVSIQSAGDRFDLLLRSPECVRGALLNLVINALEAAGVDGRVKIVLKADESSIDVDVQDSGPGFENAGMDLTEAFQTTKPNGVGLGLTIARHAVQQESGELLISRLDGWTSVKMRLPRSAAADVRRESVL